MAKDKEKQLLKNIDDKAITFQRAVFIVCNLKRLIKRPKKDDKLTTSSRKRSGEGPDSGQRGSSAWGSRGGRRGVGGSRMKEPVRRAFTLPTMLCTSLVSLQNSRASRDLPSESSTNELSGAASQTSSDAQPRDAAHQLYCPNSIGSRSLVAAAAGELGMGVLLSSTRTERTLGRADQSGGSFSCMATPIRQRAPNQQYATANTAVSPQTLALTRHSDTTFPGRSVAAVAAAAAAATATTTAATTAAAEAAAAAMIGQQQHHRRSSRTSSDGSNEAGQQLVCPIWALFMAQLDAQQGQPREQSLRELAHLLTPPARSAYLLDPEQQLHPQTNPRLLVSRERAAADSGSQERMLVSGCLNQRRSSNDEMEKRHYQNDSTVSPSGSIQIGSKKSACLEKATTKQSTSPSGSDIGSYSRKKQQEEKFVNQENEEEQPMKRFSSALCLADETHLLNQNSVQVSSNKQQQHPSSSNKSSSKNAQRQQQVAARKQPNSLTPNKLELDHSKQVNRQRRQSSGQQTSVNVDQQALFSAVECNQLERVKSILAKGRANVNSLNGDRLTCLDIAVMQRNVEMVRVLQQHKAKESAAYLTREGRADHLYQLYAEARRLVEDLSRSLQAAQVTLGSGNGQVTLANSTNNQSDQQSSSLLASASSTSAQNNQPLMLATGSLLSSALFEEKQRQLQYWKRRLDLFMHMRYQFERLQVPSPPELIILQVVGENSLGVKIVHTLQCRSSVTTTALHQYPQQYNPTMSMAVASSAWNASQLAESTTLASLACLQGEKCSHWMLADLTRQLQACSSSSRAHAKLEEFSTVQCKRQEQQQAHRLAVFNQLLAEQLQLLSQQQHQHHQLQQLPIASQRQLPKHQLLLLSQSSSTESAQSRLSGPDSGPPPPCAHEPEPGGCPSLAYRLMIAASGSHHRNYHNLHAHHHHYHLAANTENRQDQKQQLQLVNTSDLNGEDQQTMIITKYRVEWAENEAFEPVLGSLIIYNTNIYPLECQIEGLISGQVYYVRVSSGNHRGFCEPRASAPERLAPSSWRQVDGLQRKRRCDDEEVFRKFTKLILLNKHILDDHRVAATSSVTNTTNSMSTNSASQSSYGTGSGANKSSLISMLLLDATAPSASVSNQQQLQQQQDLADKQVESQCQNSLTSSASKENNPSTGSGQQPALSMRKNLKNFFQPSSFKFHKLNNQNKRGLYLCTVVVYSSNTSNDACDDDFKSLSSASTNANDKIVVTNDDRLPVMEVLNELVSPAALMSDFYWLLKINGTQWMDIKRLRQQLQKSHSSSTLHLRIKLLCAIEQIQVALNLEDIGRLFYRPVQAHDGSIVICTCRQVSSTKCVSSLSTKWISLHKVIPRHLRKISDSMTATCANNTTGSAASIGSTSASTTSTVTSAGASFAVGGAGDSVSSTPNQQHSSSSSRKSTLTSSFAGFTGLGVAGNQPNISAGTEIDGGVEFRLCEYCQYQLIQRRSTMASGSSSSSIASSSESQWSQASSAQLGVNVKASASTNKCTCSLSSSCSSNQQQQQQLSAGSTRSASLMMSSTIHHPSSGSVSGLSRHSQPTSQLQAARSSTYLLLASLSLYELLLFSLDEIIHFHRSSTRPLKRGLYLGFLQLQTTVESMRLLVPRARPNMVPCVRVRDNPHVSREEWQLLKNFGSTHQQPPDEQQDLLSAQPETFGRGRAKSVSPGLLLQQQATDISSERNTQATSYSSTEQTGIAAEEISSGTPTAAHSDTELSIPSNSTLENTPKNQRQTHELLLSPSDSKNGCKASFGKKNFTASSANLTNLSLKNSLEETFVRLVGSAAKRLLTELKAKLPKVFEQQQQSDQVILTSILQSLNDEPNNRIYHVELIELSNQVSFILLLPAPENVCPVTSQEKSNILADNKDYMLLPLQIFETIHISTYEPELLGKYSRLSAILETDLIVAQHDHRQAFSSNELKSTKSRVSHLQDMVNIADEFWRKLRWIVDVVSFARDKNPSTQQNNSSAIKLSSIWRYFELGPRPTAYDQSFLSTSQHRFGQQQQQQQQHQTDHSTSSSSTGQQARKQLTISNTTHYQLSNCLLDEAHSENSSRLEVKRTSSAQGDSYYRNHNPSVCLNLPKIQLTPGQPATIRSNEATGFIAGDTFNSGRQKVTRTREQQQFSLAGASSSGSIGCQSNRKRSGDAVLETKSDFDLSNPTANFYYQSIAGDDEHHLEINSNEESCIESSRKNDVGEDEETSWVNLRLRDATEDEEAIYAYHISLKDATRAAAQRKSSQLSTQPILDEETNVTPEMTPEPKVISSRPSMLDQCEVTATSSLENLQAISKRETKGVSDAVALNPKMRHLKTTNPFLNDSFEG